MPVKNLHVAKSLKDLESLAIIKPLLAAKPTNLLISSANKVYRSAQEKYLDNDEETAYVQYIKFIELVFLLKKRSGETENNKDFAELMKLVNSALGKAEYLKESLIRRYSILETASEENEQMPVLPPISKITPEIVEDIPPGKSKDEEKLSISSSELHSLLTAQVPLVVIMDTRPENDFAESHIKSSRCISVPEEILKPGLTAAKLESVLPKESLVQWFRRKEADHIVLVDWDSEDENTQNIYLNSLKTAMSKWDQNCILKKPPMVLKGGYKDWMRKYPMLTTQALKFDLMSNVKLNPVVTDLSGIEYPNLDESMNDEVQVLNEKNSNGMLFKKSPIPTAILNDTSPTSVYPDVRKSSSAPPVNRKSKPNADPPIKYSNTEVRPASHSIKSLNHSTDIRKGESSVTEKNILPVVDRKLKITAGTDTNIKDPILESFNKEQTLAKESVEIMNQKLKSEEEFEKLCLRKELEAEESKRIEIQKQEELLLEKLKILEIESKKKDTELLKAKEENLKIKKLLDEKIYEELKIKQEKEINNMKKPQAGLLERVEKMREERKRKEAEKQRKKEVHPSIPRESASANSALRKTDTSIDKPAFQITPANASDYTMPLSRQNSDGSSRGLIRCHSSPNIAQMLNEEECAQHKIPSVDRSLKPNGEIVSHVKIKCLYALFLKMRNVIVYSFKLFQNWGLLIQICYFPALEIPFACSKVIARVTVNSHLGEINRARIRNLNPLYGNCPVRPATGLRNLGNTCFMNSVIQCLSNTIPLADYINSGQYVEHINRENKQGTGGELIEEFAVVIKALWMGQYKSFYPKDFKNTVSKCLSVCIGNEQQDSHEFLVVLMEKLHADLNRKYVKNIPKLDSNCTESTFWQHHKNFNSSKISEIFDGLLKSTLTCLSCRKTSDSFEVFSCLSLPILTSRCTLRECFQHFLRAEKISGEAAWDCPRCKQKKEAEKKLRICRVPEVFVIQLKRFSYEGLWRRKLQTHVEFDSTLEVPFEVNSTEYQRVYSLYGIVNHYGTLEGGHYTAYCKTDTGKWIKYDDHEVSEMSASDIRTSAAYLLFYISTDFQSRL